MAGIEASEVEQVLQSLEDIAKMVENGDDGGIPNVRHGLQSHAAGIRTAIQVIRADLLHENPWAVTA